MGYRNEKLTLEEAVSNIGNYKYVLVYMFSQIYLCKVEELPEIDWEECMEARFFSENGEIHIFDMDGEKKAVEIKDNGTEQTAEKRYNLDEKFCNFGNILLVQEYLAYDEDGQMYVEGTRLKGVGRGKK